MWTISEFRSRSPVLESCGGLGGRRVPIFCFLVHQVAKKREKTREKTREERKRREEGIEDAEEMS